VVTTTVPHDLLFDGAKADQSILNASNVIWCTGFRQDFS
jgi:hypothetical protein